MSLLTATDDRAGRQISYQRRLTLGKVGAFLVGHAGPNVLRNPQRPVVTDGGEDHAPTAAATG